MKYFITTVAYNKTFDNGIIKGVKEQYLVDAMTITEAEARITDEMMQYAKEDFKVDSIVKPRIDSLFTEEDAEKFYKVKLRFMTYNEKTAEETYKNFTYMVQANDFAAAYERINKEYKTSCLDYDVTSIVETPIIDIIQYDNKG